MGNKEIKETREAFMELIRGFEYIGTFTPEGRKFIKDHVKALYDDHKRLEEIKRVLNLAMIAQSTNTREIYEYMCDQMLKVIEGEVDEYE